MRKWGLSRTQQMKFVLCSMIALSSLSLSANLLFLPQILEACIAHTLNYNKGDAQLTATTAMYKSVIDSLSALIFFLLSPVLGAVSDVYGRKPVLVTLFVLGVVQCMFLLAGVYFLSIWSVIVSRMLNFSVLGTFAVSFAYATDVCTHQNKPQLFGYLLGSMGIGMTISPLALGELGKINLLYPEIVGVGIYLVTTLIAVFFLRESLHYDVSTEYYINDKPKRKMPPMKNLLNPFICLSLIFDAKMENGKKNYFIFWLSVVYGLLYVAQTDVASTLNLFVQWRFGFGPLQIGLVNSTEGLFMLLSYFVLLGLSLRLMGKRKSFLLASLTSAFGHAAYMFSYYNELFLAVALVVTGFGKMVTAICKTLVSDQIPAHKQGAALGGLYSLTSIAQVVGDLVCENSFAYFITPGAFLFLPGVQFLIGSFLFVCILGIASIVFAVYPEKKSFVKQGKPCIEEGDKMGESAEDEKARLINS